MKKIAFLLIGIASGSHSAAPPTDDTVVTHSDRWVLYDRVGPDGGPLVVVTRTGNAQIEALLRNGHLSAVVCRTDPSNVNQQGMPQGTERLYSLEDKLDEAPILREAGAIRVASVTGGGQRRMFFAHPDHLDLSSFLQSSQIQGFSCAASEITDRQMLIDLVTPTPLESQLNGDQEVIASLQKNGDDGHLPRKIDFWFYGRKEALKSLVARLKPRGFSVDHWLTGRTGIVLSREMSVDLGAFQNLTPALIDAAKQASVDYDGWETTVVSQPSSQSAGRDR